MTPDCAQVADFLYVVRGFTSHVESPCAMLQTGQLQIHTRPPGGLRPRADAIQDLEVPPFSPFSCCGRSRILACDAWSLYGMP